MFLWITPIPPARAIAIAISASVTVSIAADANGTLRVMPRVKRELVSTSRGITSERRGLSNTSSKVSTTSSRTRPTPFGAGASIREGPLPECSGRAGLEVGRVVVAIAECKEWPLRNPARWERFTALRRGARSQAQHPSFSRVEKASRRENVHLDRGCAEREGSGRNAAFSSIEDDYNALAE